MVIIKLNENHSTVYIIYNCLARDLHKIDTKPRSKKACNVRTAY
jgi:hypothetical protein